MDPTMVLAQQRMHVGESTHEVDRSGRVVRKDTSDNFVTGDRHQHQGEGKRPRIIQTSTGIIFERTRVQRRVGNNR